MAKKKGEEGGEESTPKKPILIIPLKNEGYPRVEVFVDSTSSTIGIVESEGMIMKRQSYGGIGLNSILPLLDKVILNETMTKHLKDDYASTMGEFLQLFKDHKKFMEGIINGVRTKMD